jgi:hypothetical protein
MIRIQSFHDLLVSLFPPPILKHAYMHARRVSVVNPRCQLHPTMHVVIVPHEPTDESNDDHRRLRRHLFRVELVNDETSDRCLLSPVRRPRAQQ